MLPSNTWLCNLFLINFKSLQSYYHFLSAERWQQKGKLHVARVNNEMKFLIFSLSLSLFMELWTNKEICTEKKKQPWFKKEKKTKKRWDCNYVLGERNSYCLVYSQGPCIESIILPRKRERERDKGIERRMDKKMIEDKWLLER